MKNLILTISLLLTSVVSYSQNLIGSSLRDVNKELDSKGFIINQGWTNDGLYYTSGADKQTFRIYYFTKQNICFMYAISFFGLTYRENEALLLSTGYWKSSNQDYYVNDNYMATIIWMHEYQEYFITILPKTK